MSYFLWLFILLGAALIGFALRRRSALLGQALMALGCLGAVALIVGQLYQALFTDSEKTPDRYHAVVGYMMGQYLAGELGGQRGQVGLIFPPETAANADTLDTMFNTIARVLAPFPSIELKEVPAPKSKLPGGVISREAFDQALAKVPQALAYVSFVGVPDEVETLSVFRSTPKPRFYIFDPKGDTGWLQALKAGLIQRVIVPQPEIGLPKERVAAGPPEELFAKYFLLATPQTADQIAAQLQSKRSP